MRISDWSSDVCSSDLDIGRTVHRHHAVHRQLVIEDAENRLLHFTRIGRSTDQDQLFGKIDGDHGFTAAAVALGIGPEAGQIDDGEFRHEIGKLGRLWADQQRANRSEEHTSALQSLMHNSYAVFCLKKKKEKKDT